jgi:serine/threonine-protein kinase
MDQELIAGRYRLLDRHAIGGMATIWRARDEWTREIVAVKRLHPYVVADPVARARLEREAAALRTVDHPAIVRPRELIEDPDAPSLVMDFVAGQPLDERIAGGPLPPEEAIAIATVIADALAVAHDHGIVHRDIKPANIVVDDDGAVHLVDFGIAALMDVAEDGLTAPSTMIGTLRYAAPERLAGDAVTPRTDVWALGAVLYEMLTGSPAVSNTDPAAALEASLAAPPPLDGLPPSLAAVVARAMSPDPADRYGDATELREGMLAAVARVDPEALTIEVSIPPPDPGVTRPVADDPLRPSAAGTSRRARRSIAVALAGLLGLAALVALVGPGLLAGTARPIDAARSPATSTARPAVSPSARATPTEAGPGKGKGNGKGGEKGNGN